MNKSLRFLSFLCFSFLLQTNILQAQKLQQNLATLKTNLGDLKNKLTTLRGRLESLKSKLSGKKLAIKKEPSTFDQNRLNIYALYGDNPNIINIAGSPRKLILDKDENPRLEGLEKSPYTGYGYKTANLRELQNLFGKMAEKTAPEPDKYLKTPSKDIPQGVTYNVPDFIGISSENVKIYLNNRLNISEQWKTRVSTIPDVDQKKSLQDKNLPNNFITAIAGIEQSVKQAFVQAASTTPDLDSAFKTPGIQAFLKKANNEKLKLMVRSTGKEDTDKLANAGGNETVGNIDPTTQAVLTAMGQGQEDPTAPGTFKLGVVSSYFGLKSFTQRIKAGDPSIYEEPPTAALIQVMIGETPDEITSCGVMFTEEPEGGISKEKKTDPQTGQLRTTGITRIECSYGHNEGVVNSMVPVDVYYIDNQQSINSIIREKTKRVIPVPGKGFEIKSNITGDKTKDIMISQPALSREEVRALKSLANYLEYYYKKPMDVEFVLKKNPDIRKKRIIYLVQARPIVHSEQKIQPSYIFDIENFKEKIKGEVIGIAGGALRLVKNKDECVIAETLKEALEIYQKIANTDNINCIFVKNMAPATSHEATQFRTEQKAVICFPEINTIEKWLSEGEMVLVDLQQELAVVWDGDTNLEKTLESNSDKRIKAGTVSYPIPVKLTLDDMKDPNLKKKFSATDINEIRNLFKGFLTNNIKMTNFETTHAKTGKKIFNTPLFLKKIKQELFNSIKTGDQATAKSNLFQICAGTFILIDNMLQLHKDEEFDVQSKLILNHLLIHAKKVASTLRIKPDSPNYFRRLYAARFLEAILFQAPSQDIFNNYSFETLVTTYMREKKSEKNLGKTTGAVEMARLLVQYGRAAEFTLSDLTKTKWFELLKILPTTSKTIQDKFNKIFRGLAENNLLTPWFLLCFEPATSKVNVLTKLNVETAIKDLYTDYEKDKAFIAKLKEIRNTFNELETSLWSEEKKYQKQKTHLEKIGAYFKDKAFFTSYNNVGNLGKVFATQVMEEFITLFDTSIKQLESSRGNYGATNETMLLTNIQDLITLFFTFLTEWVNNFPGANAIDKDQWSGGTTTPQKIATVSTRLKNIIPSSTTYNDQIKISPTFDVSASAIGGVKGSVENLSTIEDIFTFTHQSMLNILGFLNAKINIFAGCPQIISQLNQKLTTKTTHKATLAGISFQGKDLTIKYNNPLRGHSMMIYIKFDARRQTTAITCEMAGAGGGGAGNEFARFDKIADYIDVTSKAFGLTSISRFELGGRKIIWEWKLPAKIPDASATAGTIDTLISKAIDMSFAVTLYTAAMPGEAKIYDDTYNKIFTDNTQRQNLSNQIIDFSYKGNRLHSVFVTALERLPMNQSSSQNWEKTIAILSRLINENSPYRISTACFFFKKYHDPFSGGTHNFLGNLHVDAIQYYGELTPDNYLNATIPDMPKKINYFKFREAKKIFNYLCQISQYFDESCWNNFLNLIKNNQEWILNLQDLALDNMEGDGPAAANLTNIGTQGRMLALIKSLAKLFQNAFNSKISNVKDQAKGVAAELITMGTTGANANWATVKNVIQTQYENKFGKFSNTAIQNIIMQSIQNSPEKFVAQTNACDSFKNVYPAKKTELQTFINSLGDLALNPGPNVSKGAFDILKYLNNQGEALEEIVAYLFVKIKSDQNNLLQQQKLTTFISNLYDIQAIGFDEIILTAATEIAQTAIKSTTPAIKSEGVKLATFILSKKPDAPFNPADLIDLNDIQSKIDQYTFTDTPDKQGEKAIKTLVAMGSKNKVSVQDQGLINKIKEQIQKGYYFNNTQNSNVLELYQLVSQGIYTDADLINATREDLIKILNNNYIATSIIPGNIDQRNKICNFAAYLINNGNINAETEVWPILKDCLTNDNKRRALILILILFEANFVSDDFLNSNALNLVLTKLNADVDADQYSRIAQDCYDTLKDAITNKKYTPQNIAKIKNKLVALSYPPFSHSSGKLYELNKLIQTKYP